jgi:hypothetical protein
MLRIISAVSLTAGALLDDIWSTRDQNSSAESVMFSGTKTSVCKRFVMPLTFVIVSVFRGAVSLYRAQGFPFAVLPGTV